MRICPSNFQVCGRAGWCGGEMGKRTPVQEISHPHKVVLLEAPGGEGWGADSHTPRDDGRLVSRHAVLVHRYRRQVQHTLCSGPIHAQGLEVNQHQVVVCAAADQGVAQRQQPAVSQLLCSLLFLHSNCRISNQQF